MVVELISTCPRNHSKLKINLPKIMKAIRKVRIKGMIEKEIISKKHLIGKHWWPREKKGICCLCNLSAKLSLLTQMLVLQLNQLPAQREQVLANCNNLTCLIFTVTCARLV